MTYRRSGKHGFGGGGLISKGVRAITAIIVLTAFVLGIAFSVKQLAAFDSGAFAKITSPYLAKLGLGENMIGEVAGQFFKRVADLGGGADDSSSNTEESATSEIPSTTYTRTDSQRIAPEGQVLFSLAIIADSHIANDKPEYINNKEHLRTGLSKVKELGLGIDTIVHTGDITNLGVLGDLQEAKQILNDSGLKYYALPGDRDLFQSVGTANFLKVFGDSKFVFEKDGVKFVGLDNSASYTPISQETMTWFKNEIADADFVIFSQPLYSDGYLLFNYLYMGSSGEEAADASLAEKQAEVKAQRDELLEAVRGSNVKAILAGDHHRSDSAVDAEEPSLEHYVIGATSEVVGEYSQSILQPQKFGVLKVYENGGYMVEDILL